MSKEYCEWAYNAVDEYYGKLLKLEKDNKWSGLRQKGGQIDWILAELMIWTTEKGKYV